MVVISKMRVMAVSFLMLGGVLAVVDAVPHSASAHTAHAPILIVGDSNFISANGVTSGHGTSLDPYIISGWDITAGLSHGVEIRWTNSYYVIRDVLVHGGTPLHSGIRLDQAWNGRVESSTLTSNAMGLDMNYTHGVVVTNNTISNNVWGVFMFGCSQIVLDDNSFSSNEYYGIMLSSSTAASVTNNTFSGDGISMDGQYLGYYDTYTIPPNNLVNGKPIQYIRSQSDVNIFDMSVGELILVDCQGGRISNVSASDTDVGIEVSFSSDISIEDCTVSRCYQGLHVQYSSNMTLARNHAGYCNEGSRINDCERTTIIGNLADHNERGLILHTCSNSTVLNNTLSSNVNAMQVYYGSRSAILGNSVVSTTFISMNLLYCKNITVAENVVQDSWGIDLYNSEYVHIFLNSFLNMEYDCKEELGGHNNWDRGYPLGGNFWGDSSIIDKFMGPGQNVNGPDGIGDSYRIINSATGVRDRYPLVSPWIHKGYLIASFYVSPKITNNTATVFHLDASSTVYLLDPLVSPEVRWDWDGDGSWDVDWSLREQANHQYTTSGIHPVSLEARAADLTATAVSYVFVDNSVPKISFDWINETFHSRSGSIAWISTDNITLVDHCEYRIDGGEWVLVEGNIGSINMTGLGNGRHLLEVRAVDGAGNVGETNLSFVIDTSSLSQGGPYGSWVLISLVIAVIAFAMACLLYLRFRTGKEPN
jgi:parallel beta-helix repeat protein